jgi:NhaP-type Na+/H+ or K+/H+ antiporter
VQVSVPALAIASFAFAQSLHGSGYIAAFVGGMLFGFIARAATHKLVMPGEAISEGMSMLTWLIFGVAVIGQSFAAFTWQIIVYSILSLTLVRMLPIFLSLLGTSETNSSKLFLGWFGPRGLASIVFAIIVLDENLPGGDFLAMVVTCTVGLSLILHGVSANPLAGLIARSESTEPTEGRTQ